MNIYDALEALDSIASLADVEGWRQIDHQPKIKMVSFKKGKARINVYYTTMTVGTCIDHPKKGKTQLFRRNVSMETLTKIFRNPRIHTQRGYYRRDK